MEKLKAQLEGLIKHLENSRNFRASLEKLKSVYPFNEYECIISNLLAADKLSLKEYYELRNSYIRRNPYLHLFEFSNTRLGSWACRHLQERTPEIKTPTKATDPKYKNQYDLKLEWVNRKSKHNIQIEVKTSRAVDKKSKKPIYTKALRSNSNSHFDMNFQQTKVRCADVFVWIGVWRNKIRYWVLNRDEMRGNKYFSKKQHRGNVGEGQLHLKHNNITEFQKYEVKPSHIKEAVIEAFKRQYKIK
jgi:hypothetical protein